MEFWFSGEVDADIGIEYVSVMNEIEDTLNGFLSNNDYGTSVQEWAFIAIIMSGNHGFRESRRFSSKKREVEFRLEIPYQEFKTLDRNGKFQLFYGRLLDSIRLAKELKIPDLNIECIMLDVKRVGELKCWVPQGRRAHITDNSAKSKGK